MIKSLLVFFAGFPCAKGQDTFPQNSIGKGPGETFVHLFEWSWDDVAKECEDWLAPKGYSAVQISPPNEHDSTDGWNARYQPVSYKLISRSGNESQFKSMLQRCNAVGVDIYADVVINQMAGPWAGVGIAGTKYGYRTYPPHFGPEDFHHFPYSDTANCGVDNYQDAHNVQYCDLLGMPDLCTGCSHVQDTIAKYINHMYDLGVKGVRIDAAKHQTASELQQLLDKINPKIYRFLEVFSNYGEAVQPPPYYPLGQVTEFGYGFNLGPKFTGVSLLQNDLSTFGAAWGMMPSEQAVVFMDNHDTQRDTAPLTFQTNTVLYTLANIFMLAYPYGYPKVMSSYYFTDGGEGPPGVPVHDKGGTLHCSDGVNWVCEHRWAPIANMVHWRKSAADLPLTNFASGGNTISFCRGDKACVAINKQSASWTVTLHTSMPSGFYCDVIQSDGENCPFVIVLANGDVEVTVPRMSAVAFHVSKLPTIEFPEQPRMYSTLLLTLGVLVMAISMSVGLVMAISFVHRRAGYEIGRERGVDIRPLL